MIFNPVPFEERKTPIRGITDLISGRYPAFCFGGKVRGLIPVFHFHDVTADYLEPYLQYLAGNGYRTVNADAVGQFVVKGIDPGPKSVALCFDDAWRSLWTVVGPMLAKYGMTGITYAIPSRVEDSSGVRAAGPDGEAGSLFATWPELKALRSADIVDVQAHTYSHALIYCDPRVVDFVRPDLEFSPTGYPSLQLGKAPVFVASGMLGCPLYPCRSRMSDAFRYLDDEAVRAQCMEHVAANGGADFFSLPDWRKQLRAMAKKAKGGWEMVVERERTIYQELVLAKEALEAKFGFKTIRHVCFPWAVCGRVGEQMARKAGYETAVADWILGKRAAVKKANPYRIMRLKHDYIFCLPGNGRKSFFNARNSA